MQHAEKLRDLAATIRNEPHAREAIAAAFELIADAMTPCTDCGQAQADAPADHAAASTTSTETAAD